MLPRLMALLKTSQTDLKFPINPVARQHNWDCHSWWWDRRIRFDELRAQTGTVLV